VPSLRRIRRTGVLVAVVVVGFLGGPGVAFAYPNPGAVSGTIGVHDPAMIRTPDGNYYVFSTGAGLSMTTSTDRITYSGAGAALPKGVSWASSYTGGSATALWAPDISFHNGKYLLYFAASTFGSNTSAIGLATSVSGKPGTFVDQGKVYASNSASDFNAIDPSLTVDTSGRWWLVFGSWWSGIKLIQIDPNTGAQLSSTTTRYSLASASGGIEGAYILHHGDFYYLLSSRGVCCQGVNSTYWIAVGRSSTITGPYSDQSGAALTNGGGTKILATHANYIGPGGESVYSDTDHDLLVYHYYDATANGASKLGINFLTFSSDGWPLVS
jgi:arabinan endo-1,5-alpha-L-arabinosidase